MMVMTATVPVMVTDTDRVFCYHKWQGQDQQRSDGSTEKGEPLMMVMTATVPVMVTDTDSGRWLPPLVTTTDKAKTNNLDLIGREGQ